MYTTINVMIPHVVKSGAWYSGIISRYWQDSHMPGCEHLTRAEEDFYVLRPNTYLLHISKLTHNEIIYNSYFVMPNQEFHPIVVEQVGHLDSVLQEIRLGALTLWVKP